ncbi:MAG: flagella basal body P-ring formation protein FlgA [Chloroflexi bacterium]|nr:flagella basal body P-ring formation protein FlgA [Chloroflexota bacterium]MBV9546097.1 flagella basal body P-ring formation protein FlgA [Chloroflexota bacterium]
MAVVSVSPTRALRRPLRLDARALVGVLLMLVAIGGSIAVWSTQQDTRGVLVAAHELPAGATLTASDLAVAQARLDDSLYSAALPATALNSVVGRQLAEAAHSNQILARAQIATQPLVGPNQEVLAIPVSADMAAGGRIRPGDSVQVLGTDKNSGGSRVVLPRVTVYEVGRDSGSVPLSGNSTSPASVSSGSTASTWISLIVDQQSATQLTQARWGGPLDVALLPPQPSASNDQQQ